MSNFTLRQASLVLYKERPALVRRIGAKVEIELAEGETVRVRPKDVTLLHEGPIHSLSELQPPAGEVQVAWELLAGRTTTLAELAELAYGVHTPATSWAAWQLVVDGLYFHGAVDSIVARSSQEVADRQAARVAKAAEEQAWAAFLERARSGQIAPEDDRHLIEVEKLALAAATESRVLRELGRAETPENAHALLLELGYWDYTLNPYPQRLGTPTTPPAAPLPPLPAEDRLDLTHLAAFAIDDEETRDPDDALSFEPAVPADAAAQGVAGRLWVHVADVAALALPDSAADLEARARGVTLYLPEGAAPMLPPAAAATLGLGLAPVSPALSFGLDLTAQGKIVGVTVTPSWVRVTRLSYEEADARLEEESFETLDRLTQAYRDGRWRNGAFFIDLPEVKVTVTEGQVTLRPLPPLRSRELVLEAMLMAGESVARFALERGIALPFTTQPPPEPRDLPEGLAGMFALRRTFQPSQHKSVPGPHAGLGLPYYVRATSPLRRYMDLVVHQQLRAYLSSGAALPAPAVLERVGAAEAVSGDVRRAERLARQHWTLVYLLQRPGWRGEGILVDRYGLRGTVLIPDLGLEARVHLREDLPLNSSVFLALDSVNLPALEANFQVEFV